MSQPIKILSALALLLALCLISYGDILTHQFMIDERVYVASSPDRFNNAQIYQDSSSTIYTYYRHFSDYFTKSMGHHYIPFNYLLNVGLFKIFQTPFPLYLINVGLFFLNCILVFLFVFLISKDFELSLLTVVLFCVHPMSADMLQHITFNILFIHAVFSLAALMSLYLYAEHQKGTKYLVFSLVMVFLAVFSQETTVLFPLYALALLVILTDQGWARSMKIAAPFAVLSLVLLGLWAKIINPHVHLETIKTLQPRLFWESNANFSHVFFWYLGNMIFPKDIVFMASLPPLQGSIVFWNALWFGFLILCVILIFFHYKKSLQSFALVFFLIGVLYAVPGAQARLQDGGQWVFEPNWMYFSSIGLYLFAALKLLKIIKPVPRFWGLMLLAVLCAALLINTLNIDASARTEKSYAENWLRKFPGNFLAANIVTSYYFNHKDEKIPPDLIGEVLGQVNGYIKDNVANTPALIERLQASPLTAAQHRDLTFKLAAFHCKNNHPVECRGMLRRLAGPQAQPYDYLQLAYTMDQAGEDKTALALLEQCMRQYPRYKEPYLLIGVILGNQGDFQKSLQYWQQGLALDPTDQRFIFNINQAKYLKP